MAQTYASEYIQINDAEIDATTFIFQSQHYMKYARTFLVTLKIKKIFSTISMQGSSHLTHPHHHKCSCQISTGMLQITKLKTILHGNYFNNYFTSFVYQSL